MNDHVEGLSLLLAGRSPLSRRRLGRAMAGIGITGAGLSVAGPGAEAKQKNKKKPKPCKGGTKRCGKRCVDLQADPAHCGGCGRRCQATQFCDDGSCVDCDVCANGCDHDAPQAAVDAAPPGARIQVCPGTWRGAVTIDKDLALKGAGAGRTILHGEDGARPLAIAEGVTASVERLTVTNGAAESGGGVLNEGTLEMTACAIVDNVATGSGGFGGSGGGLLNGRPGAELTMTRCTVRGNRVGSGHGGGIFNTVDAKLTLTDCAIEENTAVADSGGFGGGIASSGRLEVDGCAIRGNISSATSGGIESPNSTNVTIINSEIRGNRGGNGGGLGSLAGAVVSGCTIAGNRSGGQAGGIDAGFGSSFTDCTIEGNRAAGDGGGMQCTSGVTLTGCVIRDNEARYRGGGITMTGTVTAKDCVISDNRSEDDGGGIVAHSGALTLDASDVRGNTAGGQGGGIRTYYAEVTLLNGSSVTGNEPDDCAGTTACSA